jgi:hypothetical protein
MTLRAAVLAGVLTGIGLPFLVAWLFRVVLRRRA